MRFVLSTCSSSAHLLMYWLRFLSLPLEVYAVFYTVCTAYIKKNTSRHFKWFCAYFVDTLCALRSIAGRLLR